VYPALAVLDAARDDAPGGAESWSEEHVIWVGSHGGMEGELVKRVDVPFATVPAAGAHGVGWRALPGNLWQLWRGFLASRRILREFRPEVLFFTGGYVAVPLALAGRLPFRDMTRPRSLLYVPDIEPGLALKILARFADRIALTADESGAYLQDKGKLKVTGYPTRQNLAAWDKENARQKLGLAESLPVLLVVGGSRGARSINRALLASLPELLTEMQVVHISGNLDWVEIEAAQDRMAADLPAELVRRYHAYPYLHEEMGAALAAADLVLSRAGASCLGEYPLFGLPAILVPYPYAWRYQQVNAAYLERRGAAVIVRDEHLAGQLLPQVRGLLNDPNRMAQMRSSMRDLAQPRAAQDIAKMVRSLATIGRGAG
jgi:UDP-N-acetylglucosamine--N-acetylmuramyl-(pentapeptide) pyrophosphoryl-undecaprenol N-acetylglucosamine transferase